MDLQKKQAQEQLEKWFANLVEWQKDLFIYLWAGANVQDSIERTGEIIDAQYLGRKSKYKPQTAFPETIDFGNIENSTARILSVSNIEGVGALSPQNEIDFDRGLTVIYGENGCGKSSYVKILKALENPMNSQSILGNVFKETNVPPKASIEFLIDDDIKTIAWNKSSTQSYPIQIYDSEVAQQFVEKKQEVIYEPKVLATITAMAAIYERLGDKYNEQLNGEIKSMTPKAKDVTDHKLVKSFEKISSVTGVADFVIAHSWSNELAIEQETIIESLQESDGKKSIERKRNQIKSVTRYKEDICTMMVYVSDLECSDYLSKRQNQIAMKAKADEIIEQSKNLSSILAFGSDEWKRMWESCLGYIRLHHKEANIPLSEDGLCALCQQKVDDSTYARMESFEKIKISDAIECSEHANKLFAKKVKFLQEKIENTINFSEVESTLQLAEISEPVQKSILGFYNSILSRCQWLLSCENDDISKLPILENRRNIESFFDKTIEKLKAEIKVMDATISNRENQIERVNELVAIQWIADNFDKKKQQIILGSVISKCRTNTLTTLKKTLSKLLITEAYISKFKNEMQMLDEHGKIKVELTSAKPEKGKAYHQIVLSGIEANGKHKNGEILSEGEFRVVSLAAFLADLSSWSSVMPFVFDDPITSLDHKFEDRVAKRLVRLSTERQVIVFTHRLTFAKLLENNIDEFNADLIANHSLIRAKIEQIELRNNPLGKAQKPSYQNVGFKKALKKLISEDIAKIKKAQKLEDYSTADCLLQGVASSFRNLIEQSIEHELLHGVVTRYKHEVSSMKLPYLMALEREDIELFHEMMSKYSSFDHSHSLETSPQMPDIDAVESDVNTMLVWVDDYKRRSENSKKEFEGKLK